MTSENSHLKGIPSELIMSAGGLNEVASYLEQFQYQCMLLLHNLALRINVLVCTLAVI